MTKYLGEGMNLWLFRNSVTLLCCPVSAGCVYSVIKLSRILLFLVDNILPGWRRPSPAQPSPAPLALGSNVIANLNIFIWHFMFSNGHNNLCLRILLIQRQRNGNSSHQMCIAWILEMLSAAHPCFTGHSAFPIKWITSTYCLKYICYLGCCCYSGWKRGSDQYF